MSRGSGDEIRAAVARVASAAHVDPPAISDATIASIVDPDSLRRFLDAVSTAITRKAAAADRRGAELAAARIRGRW